MIALFNSQTIPPQTTSKPNRSFGWLSKRSFCKDLLVQEFRGLSVVKLRSDLPALQQRKMVLRAVRHAPVTQSRLVVDISALPEDSLALATLIADAANEAARSRLSLGLSGVSPTTLALLELTGMSKMVRCFGTSGEAITAYMKTDRRVENRTA